MNLALDVMTSDEWHVLKGETQYGPYTYAEMIRMMQGNLLFNFDYVWATHLEAWTPLADLGEFSPDRLLRVSEKNTQSDVFNHRAHDRVHCNLSVYAHDDSRLWNGTCENVSTGGALLFLENPLLLPGHIVQLHFRNANGTSVPFNVSAEILTKRLTKQRIQHDTSIHYAVKFINLPPTGLKQVQKWIVEFSEKSDKGHKK